jgi:ketosteroid isomerase-like protein
METLETNKGLVRRYMNAITEGDDAAMLACLHEDAVIHVMGSHLFAGSIEKRTLIDTLDSVKEMFPDGIEMRIHNMVAEGCQVAVEAESHALHSSGKIYNNKYHYMVRILDGKIIEIREYADTEHVTDVLCGGKRRAQSA